MKIKKAEIKTCHVAYLYGDGHLVMVHKKRDRDAGDVYWVTIYESIGIECRFDGRLIIDACVLPFLSVASRIEAKEAATDRGSQKTKEMGLPVEAISLYNGSDWGWHLSNFPGIISSQLSYQAGETELYSDIQSKYYWAGHSIKATYNA